MAGAAGDCIGGPMEGAVSERFRLPTPTWNISDDMVLSLATAKALLATRTVDPAAIAAGFVQVFSQGGIPGLGASTLKALRDLKDGVHWALAGRRGERAAGNGAAMRIAPLGFFLDVSDVSSRRTIRDVCRITHHNDEAYVAALAVLLAMQMPQGGSLTSLAATLPDTRVRDVLLQLAALPHGATSEQAALLSGTSGYAPESVPLALYLAFTATSVEEGIIAAVECGGDTDTIASMVGQILGARGLSPPREWSAQVPCRAEISELCASSIDSNR
tara:strand:+ start:607 stop:1428 length:822 start_codon:yes stop_codon:yes gene_type:complete